MAKLPKAALEEREPLSPFEEEEATAAEMAAEAQALAAAEAASGARRAPPSE